MNPVRDIQSFFLKSNFCIKLPSTFRSSKCLPFLGAFPKLRNGTVTFVMCARLSVHPSVSCHWKYFQENWYGSFFLKNSFRKNSSFLETNNNNGHFTWRPIYIYDHISFTSSSSNETFSDKSVEKIKTHILCSITFSRKSCRLWDNVEKYVLGGQATDDNIIWQMSFPCSMTKATDTHSECVIFFAFPLQ